MTSARNEILCYATFRLGGVWGGGVRKPAETFCRHSGVIYRHPKVSYRHTKQATAQYTICFTLNKLLHIPQAATPPPYAASQRLHLTQKLIPHAQESPTPTQKTTKKNQNTKKCSES